MAYTIEWSYNAQNELDDVFNYLESNWTEREISKFAIQLENTLAWLSVYPFMFPTNEQQSKVRRCVFSKQSSIYYTVNDVDNIITILSFFDNRKNPGALHI